jgi:hypothetical protein
VVLCLSQDGACTDSFENFHENSLKGDLSNDITLNPSLFSLVNTFNLHSFELFICGLVHHTPLNTGGHIQRTEKLILLPSLMGSKSSSYEES